jgi:hypothetical protein
MYESTIKKVIRSIMDLRERAANASRDRSVAKIDTFDVRSHHWHTDRLNYLAKQQMEKEYQQWRIEYQQWSEEYQQWRKREGLEDGIKRTEFSIEFDKKVLGQSSLANHDEVDVHDEFSSQDRVLGRENADLLYWSEKSRLRRLIKARDEEKAKEVAAGLRKRKLAKAEGDEIYRLELALNERALMIAYHEYLIKIRGQKIAALKKLALGVFCLRANLCKSNDSQSRKFTSMKSVSSGIKKHPK